MVKQAVDDPNSPRNIAKPEILTDAMQKDIDKYIKYYFQQIGGHAPQGAWSSSAPNPAFDNNFHLAFREEWKKRLGPRTSDPGNSRRDRRKISKMKFDMDFFYFGDLIDVLLDSQYVPPTNWKPFDDEGHGNNLSIPYSFTSNTVRYY